MNGLELLKENPKAALVIKQFYLERLLEGLKDESLPEDFKEIVRQQGIDEEKIAVFIDSSPRNLFDVFDKNKIYIQIGVDYNDGGAVVFRYSFDGKVESNDYSSRLDAEKDAIVQAFNLLNEKL